jgi:hypothetical protein
MLNLCLKVTRLLVRMARPSVKPPELAALRLRTPAERPG